MSASDLWELTATEIAAGIRAAAFRAQDVAGSCLERTRQIDGDLRAWVCVDGRYIEAQASAVDKVNTHGSIAGVPIGVKDVFNTEFYPTQKGSPAWRGYQAGNDARCVSYLRWEGGIVFGKTDTSELAVHANGQARNPHRLSHVTGSSSGGSAAAVAAGMVPAALGTQTGGSTIRPASWCGVYAMKPSFGLIPRTGVLKTTDTLDTIGFFTRSIRDLELLLTALSVRGANFPTHMRRLREYSASVTGKWRVAFCRSHFWDCTAAYVRRALEAWSSDLAHAPGFEVVDLPLPQSTVESHLLHRRIYHPDLGYYLRSEMRRAPDQISRTLREIFEDSTTIPAADYARALNEQTALAADLERFFADHEVDAIVMSSSNGSAPVAAEPAQHRDLNGLWTMAWLPVINVPRFRCPAGLPFGLQLVGPKFSDHKLFALLRDLEKHALIPRRAQIVSPPFRS